MPILENHVHEPAVRVRAALTLLNLRSERIEQLLHRRRAQLPAYPIVMSALRQYEHDWRQPRWNCQYYRNLRQNLRTLQTQLANSNLRTPAFQAIYRQALTHLEESEAMVNTIIDILVEHPELDDPDLPDTPTLPIRERSS